MKRSNAKNIKAMKRQINLMRRKHLGERTYEDETKGTKSK
jgi:hypothetical protein